MNNISREFSYVEERFADIQLLRYRLDGFEQLSLEQKIYAYCLAQATLCGLLRYRFFYHTCSCL